MRNAPLLLVAMLVATSNAFADAATPVVKSSAPPSVIFELLALNRDLPTPVRPKYLSPTDLVPSPEGSLLFVAEQTAKRIDVVDVGTESVIQRIKLPNEVTGIAVSPNGSILYATCSSDLWPAGMVCVVDVASGHIGQRLPAGFGARAPVLTPDGTKLYVCNRFESTVSVIDLTTGRTARKIPVLREPFCSAVTPDGKKLLIGHLLPADRSTDTTAIASSISCIDALADTLSANLRLPRGSVNVRGIAVSPDGKYAFATHTISKFSLVVTSVERGWQHTNNISIVELTQHKIINTVNLDRLNSGRGDPSGIRFSDDGNFLCITHAGSHELSILDYQGMMDTVLSLSARNIDLRYEFSILQNVQKVLPTGVNGPRSLAIIGTTAFIAGYFADSTAALHEFDLSLTASDPSGSIPLDVPQTQTGNRRGEANFHDALLCYQKWRSCHSCHPFGRVDGLNWKLGGGTIVAPKNSTSMVDAWWSPPTTWTGRRGHAQRSIVAAIELELFKQATRELAEPIDTFVMNLRPTPSPFLDKGRLNQAAQRGRAIFYDSHKSDCSVCHVPPLFIDNKSYNTQVPDSFDANTQWVTPGLREAWRTAPYNHLGSMTLREMITLPTMSPASATLSSQEIDDLVAYVLSL